MLQTPCSNHSYQNSSPPYLTYTFPIPLHFGTAWLKPSHIRETEPIQLDLFTTTKSESISYPEEQLSVADLKQMIVCLLEQIRIEKELSSFLLTRTYYR